MSFRNLSVRTFLLFSLFLAGPAFAEIMIPPAGLNVGDQYRLFFMTSGERDGTSANIEDYNAFVQSHVESSPQLAALDLEWNAVLSTETVDARDNTGTNPEVDGEGVPIYMVSGERVARNYVGLWDFEFGPKMNVDEFGNFTPFDDDADSVGGIGVVVWTGTMIGGVAATGFTLGSTEPVVGEAVGGGVIGFGTGSDDANELHHVYGMSGVITVPEPLLHFCWLLFVPLCLRRTFKNRT